MTGSPICSSLYRACQMRRTGVVTGIFMLLISVTPLKSQFVYVSGTTGVSAFRINVNGSLTAISSVPSGGVSPNAISASDRFVYVTNSGTPPAYADGSVSGFRINNNGSLIAIGNVSVTSPAGVAVDPSGQFAFVAGPGTCPVPFRGGRCEVSSYRISDSGQLTLVNATVTTARSPVGPVVDPRGRFVYFLVTADNAVAAFGINTDGSLSSLGFGAAGFDPLSVAVDASGGFLYATNLCINVQSCGGGPIFDRGSISAFKILADGSLTSIGTITDAILRGSGPIIADRTGKFVYMITQCSSDTPPCSSNSVVALRIAASGLLTPIGVMVTTPVGVKATSMIIDSSGRFAYILSNDPDNTVSSYRVNPDGSLAAISKIGAGGAAGVVGGYSLATTPLQPVNIDIRPNVPDPATINIDPEDDGDKRATVAVAILSNDAFDAVTEIDRSSLTFGHSGDENSLASCTSRTLVQVDQVARRGLLCNFVVRRTAFQLGDSTGVLKGRTIHNVPLRGTDAVRIVLVKDE